MPSPIARAARLALLSGRAGCFGFEYELMKMAAESMALRELSAYLKRPADELDRMATRGKIPGRRIAGEWRFERSEIQHWLETRLHALSESELTALDGSPTQPEPGRGELLVTPLLSEKTTAVPLRASTKPSVLRSLVELADKSGEVYHPAVILDAVLTRERLLSTALDCAVALPHWRRPLCKTIGTNLIAYGRTSSGIPFGAPGGGLTDIFLLVLCRDDRTHSQVLARLARLLQLPDFLDQLRAAPTATATLRLIEAAEHALLERAVGKPKNKSAHRAASSR